MTALDTRPDLRGTTEDSDELAHLVCCCDDDTAMCGLDVTDEPWCVADDQECVVCRDLWPDDTPCPRCGCTDC